MDLTDFTWNIQEFNLHFQSTLDDMLECGSRGIISDDFDWGPPLFTIVRKTDLGKKRKKKLPLKLQKYNKKCTK